MKRKTELWLFKKLGGVETALEIIKDSGVEEKRELFHALSEPFFNLISPNDILRRVGASWTYKGRALQDAQVKQIREEAEIFNSYKLREILFNELRYLGNVRLYERSQTSDDIIAAKMLLYLVDALETKLNEMSK